MFNRIGRLTVMVAVAAASVPVAALAKDALQGERLGLASAADYRLVDGHCTDCGVSPAALWYFENDVIAVPRAAGAASPSLLWIGSPEILEHGTMSPDGASLRVGADDARPLSLTPKIPTNHSYYDASTTAFFAGRPLRVRGRSGDDGGFVARTIWPEDLSLAAAPSVQPLSGPESLASLIGADPVSPLTRVLWERPGAARAWAGRSALAFVLSGAQGDDDEALGGHFAVATGTVGAQGEWADWTVNNFYNLDSFSEKGIVAARVPMDNYLMDLNSGQAYYRPNYVLAVILRDREPAQQYQQAIDGVYDGFYRHDRLYHHSASNCAGLSLDALRGLGWEIPRRGPTGYPKAMAAFVYMGVKERSVKSGEKIFDYLTEETTRLLPRVAFDAAGSDVLQLVRGERKAATEYERALKENVEAIVFVRLPQVPSSRAVGAAPVASFAEYQERVPADTSKWKIIPVEPRPFPLALRGGAPLPGHRSSAVPFVALTGLVLVGGGWGTTRGLRRRFRRRALPTAAA